MQHQYENEYGLYIRGISYNLLLSLNLINFLYLMQSIDLIIYKNIYMFLSPDIGESIKVYILLRREFEHGVILYIYIYIYIYMYFLRLSSINILGSISSIFRVIPFFKSRDELLFEVINISLNNIYFMFSSLQPLIILLISSFMYFEFCNIVILLLINNIIFPNFPFPLLPLNLQHILQLINLLLRCINHLSQSL